MVLYGIITIWQDTTYYIMAAWVLVQRKTQEHDTELIQTNKHKINYFVVQDSGLKASAPELWSWDGFTQKEKRARHAAFGCDGRTWNHGHGNWFNFAKDFFERNFGQTELGTSSPTFKLLVASSPGSNRLTQFKTVRDQGEQQEQNFKQITVNYKLTHKRKVKIQGCPLGKLEMRMASVYGTSAFENGLTFNIIQPIWPFAEFLWKIVFCWRHFYYDMFLFEDLLSWCRFEKAASWLLQYMLITTSGCMPLVGLKDPVPQCPPSSTSLQRRTTAMGAIGCRCSDEVDATTEAIPENDVVGPRVIGGMWVEVGANTENRFQRTRLLYGMLLSLLIDNMTYSL